MRYVKNFDIGAAILFLLVGGAFVWESRKLAATAFGSSVGPDLFPLVLGSLLVLLSIKLIFESRKQLRASTGASDAADGEKPDNTRFLLILGATIAYVLLMEPLGYIISTFLFLLTGFQVMSRSGLLKSIGISAAFSILVYVLYVNLLQGTLPPLPAWLGM
ncbi:tripartite tricarboxylate transporter TctB family protein [Paenibacillus turpanensis]|uniref:tripartite tricarboxylate transporter TctB family protein n=1 Tax=Paenibacillus turpanensis TaxID=2689078 RepID=UPI00140B671A|nr:tripartite tricarboxylate transporter TctB family protein [Paenibacillus turpanensis]